MVHNRALAIKLIEDKLNKRGFMTYCEIANVTNYHPKYILKLKEEVIKKEIKPEHGNKNRTHARALSQEEMTKIINLYRKSHVSIRKFCQFYSKRSYSCIYGVLKKNNLIKQKN